MLNIKFSKTINSSPAVVRELLLDHANLGLFFNAKYELVKAQNSDELPGGVGAIRRRTMRGSTFLDQIIVAGDQHIAYKITGKGPVTNHRGDIYLTNNGLATNLDYTIKCSAPWWQPDWLVALVIKHDIGKGLDNIVQYFALVSEQPQ